MSYWIGSQTPIGLTNTTPALQLIKYHFEVDTEKDIPAQNAFSNDGVKIAMTSTAHTIDTDKLYKLDSSGNWNEQSNTVMTFSL